MTAAERTKTARIGDWARFEWMRSVGSTSEKRKERCEDARRKQRRDQLVVSAQPCTILHSLLSSARNKQRQEGGAAWEGQREGRDEERERSKGTEGTKEALGDALNVRRHEHGEPAATTYSMTLNPLISRVCAPHRDDSSCLTKLTRTR